MLLFRKQGCFLGAGNQKKIALVGLMGSGKSRVGRELASILGVSFFDADKEIEKAAGMTVAEIFERYGEQAFRDGEKKVITRLLNDKGALVLATGGGAYMNEELRRTIKEKATCVWLKAGIDLLLERTGRTSHRPLLKDKDPREVLQKLIDVRYPIYAEADITVETSDVSPRQMAEKIVMALEVRKNG